MHSRRSHDEVNQHPRKQITDTYSASTDPTHSSPAHPSLPRYTSSSSTSIHHLTG